MDTKPLKILFWGTPELTTTILDTLLDANLVPQGVVTNPDRPQGRKNVLTAPEAKLWAQAHNIDVHQPENLDQGFYELITKESWDLFIVVAYGKILPKRFIEIPKLGTLNIHYSLLPKYRGATPVESAILSGDTTTGVTIQKMEFKLDSGPIILQKEIELQKEITTPLLRAELNEIGKNLLVEAVALLKNGKETLVLQNEKDATYCHKISKEDGLINLEDAGIINDRKYRAYFGWPGSYFFIEHNNQKIRIKINDAKLENNNFVIRKVIPEGKKEMSYDDFLRGFTH